MLLSFVGVPFCWSFMFEDRQFVLCCGGGFYARRNAHHTCRCVVQGFKLWHAGVGLFNRYRAFRRASDMRCMLYVICCRMCILGHVDAILGVCCEGFGATWIYPGAIVGHVGVLLQQLWEVLGGTWVHPGGSGLGFRL